MRNFKVLVLSTVFILATACTKKNSDAAGGTSAPSATENEIRIGQFGSMTGGEATFGISTDKGVRLAIDAKNAAGGIKGKPIKLITADNQGKPEEAAAVVKKLITQDKVIAVLGEVASTRSLAAAPIAQNYKDSNGQSQLDQPSGHAEGRLYFSCLLYRSLPRGGNGQVHP